MKFVAVPDDQPSPSDYLRMGLPRPNLLVNHRLAGSVEVERGDRLAMAPASSAVATTTVDSNSVPQAVRWSPSSRYLARPPSIRWGDIYRSTPVRREPTGFLTVRRDRAENVRIENDARPIDENCKIVTFDRSVYFAGLHPSRFKDDEVVFISTALYMDSAVTIYEGPGDWRGSAYDLWSATEPVPLDPYVIRIFKQICSGGVGVRLGETAVDRTDLLCAATAILYEVPLYTTDPKLYKNVRTGLKTIKYMTD